MLDLVAGRWGSALLLEYVLLEVVTVLNRRRGAATAVRVCEILLDAKEIELVPCSEWFEETVKTFGREAKSGLSFVDAAIVAVCRGRRIRDVATFDSDFRNLSGIHVIPG